MYLFTQPPFDMAVSALSWFAVSLFALFLIAQTLCRFDHKGVVQRILLQHFHGIFCWYRQLIERPNCITVVLY